MNAPVNEIRRKNDLAVQNQAVRIVKLWWERFGYFFSKPNHSSAPVVSCARTNTFTCLLEGARLQVSIGIGTSPLSQTVNSGECGKTVSTRRINESTVLYFRVFLVQTGAAHPSGRHSHDCDLALKRNSQIFPSIISLSWQFGFEQPNHFFL